jgi:cysteine desulfuration protein SufE
MSIPITQTSPGVPALPEKQRELCARLAELPNLQQRLNWLVELARARPPLPPELCTEAHRVPGCLARLWLVAEFRDGCCWFRAESDSLIIKATAGLLCDFYSGQVPAEILAHDPAFLAPYGIQQHLTPNRRNALARVWTEIQAFAKGAGVDALKSET